MMRRLLAAAVAMAVQMSALTGPFLHAHLDDHATDHHGGHAIHSHLSSHPTHAAHHEPWSGPIVGDDDHDTPVYLPLFVAVGSHSFELTPATTTFAELPAPAESRAHRSVSIVHGHDPPFRPSVPSRAPPAFLS